jgi:hypothetical protein
MPLSRCVHVVLVSTGATIAVIGCSPKTPVTHNTTMNTTSPEDPTSNQTASQNPVPTTSEILRMTPDELGEYAFEHEPLPFVGDNLSRNDPKQAQSVFGTRYKTHDGTVYASNQYHIIDSWSGSVAGKTFLLDIYKQNDGAHYVMGLADNGYITFSKTFDQNIWITNFTGSYMVFATPNAAQGNPTYALNLATGQFVTDDETARKMSGILMGGYPGEIMGLPKGFKGDVSCQKH